MDYYREVFNINLCLTNIFIHITYILLDVILLSYNMTRPTPIVTAQARQNGCI